MVIICVMVLAHVMVLVNVMLLARFLVLACVTVLTIVMVLSCVIMLTCVWCLPVMDADVVIYLKRVGRVRANNIDPDSSLIFGFLLGDVPEGQKTTSG